MLGFWVVRVPEGLQGTEFNLFAEVASKLTSPFDEGAELRDVMVNQVAIARNRVAHHEPILFRSKHVFTRAGDPKVAIDLIASLLGAIDKFRRSSAKIANAARTFAPMASRHIDDSEDGILRLLDPYEAQLEGALEERRRESRARRAARRA